MTEPLLLSCACNRNAVPANQPQLIYVLVELAPHPASAAVRLPLNFALVLDRSGSMAGEKLRSVKQAAKHIVEQLQPDDILSIVAFDSKPQIITPAQKAASKHLINQQIDRIKDGGNTEMASAIYEGLNQIYPNLNPGTCSRLVLLTDGDATDDDKNAPLRMADQAGAMGIPVIGLGFGSDWNESFLLELADRSILAAGTQSGACHYIKKPENVLQIFNEVYQSMQIVAQNVAVTLRMVQGVEARRATQVMPMIKDLSMTALQGRAVVIPVKEMEKSGASFLIELMLPPRAAGTVRAAQADVGYTLTGGQTQRASFDILVDYSQDPARIQQVNGKVMNVVERVQAFKLQTIALKDADLGNVAGATQKLQQAVTILLAQGETEMASQLQEEVKNLQQDGQISDSGRKTIRIENRKTVRLK